MADQASVCFSQICSENTICHAFTRAAPYSSARLNSLVKIYHSGMFWPLNMTTRRVWITVALLSNLGWFLIRLTCEQSSVNILYFKTQELTHTHICLLNDTVMRHLVYMHACVVLISRATYVSHWPKRISLRFFVPQIMRICYVSWDTWLFSFHSCRDHPPWLECLEPSEAIYMLKGRLDRLKEICRNHRCHNSYGGSTSSMHWEEGTRWFRPRVHQAPAG